MSRSLSPIAGACLLLAGLLVALPATSEAQPPPNTLPPQAVPSLPTPADRPTACVSTLGFYKTHPDAWPALPACAEPDGCLLLGATDPTEPNARLTSKADLVNILNTPPAGDVAYNVLHQLIPAMLNQIALGGTTPVDATIDEANVFVGNYWASPPTTPQAYRDYRDEAEPLIEALDEFNNGEGADSCDALEDGGDTAPEPEPQASSAPATSFTPSSGTRPTAAGRPANAGPPAGAGRPTSATGNRPAAPRP
jgi:hypothetical protein